VRTNESFDDMSNIVVVSSIQQCNFEIITNFPVDAMGIGDRDGDGVGGGRGTP